MKWFYRHRNHIFTTRIEQDEEEEEEEEAAETENVVQIDEGNEQVSFCSVFWNHYIYIYIYIYIYMCVCVCVCVF